MNEVLLKMEASPGFEPGNGGFANLSLNHLGMTPKRHSSIVHSRRVKRESNKSMAIEPSSSGCTIGVTSVLAKAVAYFGDHL